MEICEERDKFPDEKSPVAMEACVNNKLDEIHRDITENETETKRDTMKMVI